MELLELRGVEVGEFAGADALFLGGLLHLQTVFVRAGHEERVFAVQALEPRDRVRCDVFVCVADVRLAVGVGDRRGHVEAHVAQSTAGH